ncbi:hypothetical protein ACTXT7_010994 [Hymenolepis weldensis]
MKDDPMHCRKLLFIRILRGNNTKSLSRARGPRVKYDHEFIGQLEANKSGKEDGVGKGIGKKEESVCTERGQPRYLKIFGEMPDIDFPGFSSVILCRPLFSQTHILIGAAEYQSR